MFEAKIICRGKVQGVGFRYSTQLKAISLDLHGNVTNLEDNSVVINTCGDLQNIIKLVDWCHVGPNSSNIKELFINYKKIKKLTYNGFAILR